MSGDYGSLKSRLADELNRTDLTSQIALEIQSAIAHYESQRFWFNEGQSLSSTSSTGDPRISLPTDFLEAIRIEITISGLQEPLYRLEWNEFSDLGGGDTGLSSGVPSCFSINSNEIWLYPRPNGNYIVTLTYAKQLTTLSGDTDTNSWMTDGEELIRHRARQAVKINYLELASAIGLINPDEPYLSPMEKAAHKVLLRKSRKRLERGRMVTDLPPGRSAFNINIG